MIPFYSENTDILDQYLQNNDAENDENDLDEMPILRLEINDRRNLKRKSEILEEITVEPLLKRRSR